MQYGYFDDAQREYVITRPDTPKPWTNYLGSEHFGGVITNNAAGYTFYRSANQGRLTRFQFNAPPRHLPGRYVYLRDQDSGAFWSTSWLPVGPASGFACECRHGTGYTIMTAEHAGIRSEVRYFVPLGATYEVWQVTVTNAGPAPRRLRAFPYLEWQCNWHAEDDTRNLQYCQYIARVVAVDGMLDKGHNVNMPEDPEHFDNKDQARHLFMAIAGAEPAGFDGDREAFLGPYGDYAAPAVVAAGTCTGSLAVGDNPCGAFQVELALAPGESRTFAVGHGVGRAEAQGAAARASLATPEQVAEAFAEVRQANHAKLEALQVSTPDPLVDSMLNTWAPYNCRMTFYWSRTASLVYAGERDGLGFRDSLQDMLGAMAVELPEARRRLELLLTGQLANGGALPVVQPFAHRPGQMPEPEHYRADDCLWFFNAVPEYVKESGDLDFLRQVLPFADRGEATVLGHLRRAIGFNLARTGAHGLPCGLHADWNDCLRLGEAGESVFVAFQLRLALREYAELATRLDEAAEAEWALTELARYDQILAEHAWDGDWYLRAYRHDGLKFGSRENPEGSIFMNPQAWAVISGHASPERAAAALAALHEHLATEFGVMLCAPPYVQTDPQVAVSVLFNPGMKENGGIFNHTQGWAVMAAALTGQHERAWQYFRAALPASYNDRAELRQVEPYAVCQSTHSRFSPRFGSGRVSWLSGSATWNYFAATQYLLGIRPDYDGLRLVPCLPADWPEITVRRRFRSLNLTIHLRNPAGHGHGVHELSIDGTTFPGDLAPLATLRDGSTITAKLSG